MAEGGWQEECAERGAIFEVGGGFEGIRWFRGGSGGG